MQRIAYSITIFAATAFFSCHSNAQNSFPLPAGGHASSTTSAVFACEGAGPPLLTEMTFSSINLPPSISKELFNPNPSNNFWQGGFITTFETVYAKPSATPGVVSWEDLATPVGGACPPGTTGGGTLPDGFTIVPPVTGTITPTTPNGRTVWWFGNNLTVPGWPSTNVLTFGGMTSNAGPFVWTITTGTSELQFSNGMSSITTTNPTATVVALAPSPVNAKDDITIIVTGAYQAYTYPAFHMTVLEPYQWVRLSASPPPCAAYSASFKGVKYPGWTCLITYKTLDQNGNPLPNITIPFNEQFTSAAMPIYTGENWPQGKACGTTGVCYTGTAGSLRDRLQYANFPGLVPTLTPYGTTGGTAAVYSFTGTWRIGSSSSGVGTSVQNNTWILYQNYGDHISLESPP